MKEFFAHSLILTLGQLILKLHYQEVIFYYLLNITYKKNKIIKTMPKKSLQA